MSIHPTAIIDPRAEIDRDADIGPYAVVEGPVKIGAGAHVYPHAYLSGWTEIGRNVQIHPGAIVGHVPQDFHYAGERSYCRIGDDTIIREGASVHRGTQPESWTILGKGCFILAGGHVGHNCELADGVKVYNCTALSGHVQVGRNAIVSGYSLVHQFVRIGEFVMIGGGTRITKDVPPYFSAIGESECYGYNAIGLRRCGEFSAEEMGEVKTAYRTLYRSGQTFGKAVETLAGLVRTRTGRTILEFLRSPSKRGFCGGTHGEGPEADEAGE